MPHSGGRSRPRKEWLESIFREAGSFIPCVTARAKVVCAHMQDVEVAKLSKLKGPHGLGSE